MAFLGSSDQFSLGSKWFWYLQNGKMYTLGPTESPNGVTKGPRRAKNVPQNPTWPIRAYFGLFWGVARPEIFLSPFWAKKGQNFFFQIFFYFHYFDSQRVWDPQKPKIYPVDPPMDPILAHFVCKKAKFGVKRSRFSQICIFVQNGISGVLGSLFKEF